MGGRSGKGGAMGGGRGKGWEGQLQWREGIVQVKKRQPTTCYKGTILISESE